MSKTLTLEDLREVIFSTIAGVRDGSIAVDKARVINDLVQSGVDSGKVEVDFLRVTDGVSSGFLQPAPASAHPRLSGVAPANGIDAMRRQLEN